MFGTAPSPLQRFLVPLSEGVAYYGYARVALVQGMQFVGVEPGDSVLIPEYMCREVTDYIDDAGFGIKYYRIREDLTADIEHVRSQFDARTKAVLAVHYFGFPQPLCELQQVCRHHGVYLIEDNAHGFLSLYQGNPLGLKGDIGVFSLRKTLLTPDGAALIMNAPELKARPFAMPETPKPSRALEWYWAVESVLKAALIKRPGVVRVVRKTKQLTKRILGDIHPYPSRVLKGGISGEAWKGISSRSWFQLCQTDFDRVLNRRRTNYLRLIEWLQDAMGCRIVYPFLPEGICPLVFPILVENGQEAILELRSRGVGADYWPDLPVEITGDPQEYIMANYFRRHLVTLPIHQHVQIVPRSPSTVVGERLHERLLAAYRPNE